MAGDSRIWLRASHRESAGAVARRAIAGRLVGAWKCLTKAANARRHKKRHVHKLRVATRRADAAFTLFEDFLPRRRAAWMRKQLDKLRHAAGEARDLDVLFDNLSAEARGAAVGELIENLRRRRKGARRPITKLYKRLKHKGRFERRMAKLVREVPKIGKLHAKLRGLEFGEWARLRLEPLVADFFNAEPDEGWDQQVWHAFRIRGKALRYGLELLAAALPVPLRTEQYPLLGELQERLGEINDLATADERLRDSVGRASTEALDALEQLAEKQQLKLVHKRLEFETWYAGSARGVLRAGLLQPWGEEADVLPLPLERGRA